jgi:hypothetical protein
VVLTTAMPHRRGSPLGQEPTLQQTLGIGWASGIKIVS